MKYIQSICCGTGNMTLECVQDISISKPVTKTLRSPAVQAGAEYTWTADSVEKLLQNMGKFRSRNLHFLLFLAF